MPSTGLTEAFITLLNKEPKNPGFIVEESEDSKQIIITPTEQKDASTLFAEITEVFKSQASTLTNMPFKLTSTSLNSEDIIPDIESPLLSLSEITSLSVAKILEKFFGTKELNNIGYQTEWQTVKSNSNQIIFRILCPTKIKLQLRTAQVETYKFILSHARWEDLYSALAKTNPKPLRVVEDSEEYGKGPISPFLEQLFPIREENGQTFIYFDCISLIKCILAPKFGLVENQSIAGSNKIVVDKADFMLYMSSLLNSNQGILFHPHQAGQVLPISIACRNTIQAKTLIDFGIDCSGSMLSVFPKLKTLLKQLIVQLYNHNDLDNNATEIRLSRFGAKDSNFPIITMPLTDQTTLSSVIDQFTSPGESTAVYKFITTQHNSYKQLNNYNIISILITDGQDNDSEVHYKPNPCKTDQLSQTLSSLKQESSPPKFFSMEIGDKIDDVVLEIIKQATHGTRISVGNNLESFKLIFDHVGKLALYRRFVNFEQQARSFRLPVIEGEVTIASPEDYLEPNQPFTMNGDPVEIKPNHNKAKKRSCEQTTKAAEENSPQLMFSSSSSTSTLEKSKQLPKEQEESELLAENFSQAKRPKFL